MPTKPESNRPANRFASRPTRRQLIEENVALCEAAADLERRVNERTWELQSKYEQLHRELERRRKVEAHILDISERELRRIGHDLHDNVCSQLSGIEFLCQSLTREFAIVRGPAAKQVRAITWLLQGVMEDTRRLAHGLSPLALDAQGLILGLRDLAARTRRVYRCPCCFRGNPKALVRDPSAALQLYRIAQEALANAIKHSHALHLWITLAVRDSMVILRIRDDGCGIPPRLAPGSGLGLLTMEIRANAIGGSLVVQRNHHHGTDVICTIPEYFPASTPEP